jgi:hypothetical protein
MDQTVDVHVTVVDDHSLDNTPRILDNFPGVQVIRYPIREPRGYHRLGKLCNIGRASMPKAQFYMVSGDDTVFPVNYVEFLTLAMEKDRVDIASGHARGPVPTGAPDGSGRMFEAGAWEMLGSFSETIAWESGQLVKAILAGMVIKKYPIKKIHLRPKDHATLTRYGHCAHTLGRPIMWTVMRVVNDIVKRKKPTRRALSILWGHLEYSIKGKPRVEYADDVRAHCQRLVRKRLWSGINWPVRKLLKKL